MSWLYICEKSKVGTLKSSVCILAVNKLTLIDPWENLPALPSSCWVPPHLSLTPSPFSSSFLSLSVYYFLGSCWPLHISWTFHSLAHDLLRMFPLLYGTNSYPPLRTQVKCPHLYKTFPDSLGLKLVHLLGSHDTATPYGAWDIASQLSTSTPLWHYTCWTAYSLTVWTVLFLYLISALNVSI